MRIQQAIFSACALAAASLSATAFAQTATTQPADAQPATTQPTSLVPTTEPADTSMAGTPELPAGATTGPDLANLSIEDLMNVEVTSVSRKKQNIFEAPAAVSVITQDDIRRSGYDTIPDALRLAPGVDVARINSYSWAVGVRGLNSQFNDNLLVLQDGRSLYTPLFGGVFWDTVDYVMPDIDRIEVIRGPGATLWGANAVNGVINITTKDAQDTQSWLLDTRYSNDDSDLSLRYGGKIDDDTFYRVYFKGKYNNEFDDASGDNAGDDWYGAHGGFRVDHHASDQDTFTLQGDVGNNTVQEPFGFPSLTPPAYTDLETVNRNDTTGNLLARWNHHISDDSDCTLQVYYDFLKVKYLDNDYESSTGDIDFHHRFKTGERNEVTWGLGYRLVHSDIHDSDTLTVTPSNRNDSVYSGFVQDTFALEPDHWFLTLGSKLEHNDYTGWEVEPSARLMWTPNKQNTIWAAVSRAVRTPTRIETDLSATLQTVPVPVPGVGTLPGDVRLEPNDDSPSERLTAYELGYRVEPWAGISFDTALFYNNYSQLESFTTEAPQFGTPIIIPVQIGHDVSGDTWGGEIASTVQVTNHWRLTGSYSLLETHFFDSLSTGGSDNLNTDGSSAPENQAQLRSYWDISKNIELNAGVFYVGAVDAYDIPSYVSSDINFVWRPKDGMQLAVGVMNLFDNEHPEYDAEGGQGIADEVPRTIYAEFSYQF